MTRLVLERAAQALLSLVVVTLVVFSTVRLSGDPLHVLLPDDAPEELYDVYREKLGLDESIVSQYVRFLGDAVQGDLGSSITYRIPVSELLTDAFMATAQLGLVALFIAVVLAAPAGVYASYWRGSAFDRVVRAVVAVGQAFPVFWLGILLIVGFSVSLDVLPPGGKSGWESFVLPAFTLALVVMAGLVRLTRSGMIEVLSEDYISFARSRGIGTTSLLWRHGFRNASIPALTYVGTVSANVLTGSIVVETVFSWPGLGRLMVEAIQARDFPVVQGAVLILSVTFLFINFLVDVLYLYINPRLRV